MSCRGYIRFHALSEHLLLFQQNFIWPIFLFLCSPAPWHIPSQQPLHRDSFVIKDSYELFVFEQERFTFDGCLASNKFRQQWRERDSLLLWRVGMTGWLRETDVPPVLPLHNALPFPPSSPALLLPWLQTKQNIRYRYQGELMACSASHGASHDGDSHWSG